MELKKRTRPLKNTPKDSTREKTNEIHNRNGTMFSNEWYEFSQTYAFQTEARQESDDGAMFDSLREDKPVPSSDSRLKRKYMSRERIDDDDDAEQDFEQSKASAIAKSSLENTNHMSHWTLEDSRDGFTPTVHTNIEYPNRIPKHGNSKHLSKNLKPKRICLNRRNHPWQQRDDISLEELDDSISELEDGFSGGSKLSFDNEEERAAAGVQQGITSLTDPNVFSNQRIPTLIPVRKSESIRRCAILQSDPMNLQLRCHGFGDDPFSIMDIAQQRIENHNQQLIPSYGNQEMTEYANLKTGTDKRLLTADNDYSLPYRSAKRARANRDGKYYSIKEDTILIAVEASCICSMDAAVRHGFLNEDISLPFVPGCNFVGTVQCCGPEAASNGIFVGKRVAGFVKYGGNQRYISISSDNLIPVPESVCMAEASCLVSTYLPAFQALHHGMSPSFRYSRDCLRGKNVLVTDGSSLEGQAVVRLAYWAGAQEVFAAGNKYSHDRLRSLGATAFSEDPDDWLPHTQGLADVIVHLDYPNDLFAIQSALKPDAGRLVCYARPSRKKEQPGFSWVTEMETWCVDASLALIDRASVYNPYQSLEHYPNQFLEDSTFLFVLLQERHLRPKIDQIVPLGKVPQAHHELDSPEITRKGATICNPWASQK